MVIQSYQLIIKGLDCSTAKSKRIQICRCKTLDAYGSIDIIITMYVWRLVLMTFIPIIVIITVNILIMNQLFDKNHFLDHANKINHSRHRFLVLYRISRMLIIVSSMYLLLHIPGSTLEIVKYMFLQAFQICNMKWQYYIYLTQDIVDLLTNFNYGMNFYLYIISGKHIRREFTRRHTSFRLSTIRDNSKCPNSSGFQTSSIRYSKKKQHHGSTTRLARYGTHSSV